MVDEIVVGFEDAVGEPVVAQELPYFLDRVELWALRRQQNAGDYRRSRSRYVPDGLDGRGGGGGSGHCGGDLGEVQVHRLGVAGRHDQSCTLALLRADCTEDVGGSGPLVPRCAWTGSPLAQRGDLVLLGRSVPAAIPRFPHRVAVKSPSCAPLPPGARGSFFKILDRALGLSVVTRSGRNFAVALSLAPRLPSACDFR